jgi:hypothetical protein
MSMVYRGQESLQRVCKEKIDILSHISFVVEGKNESILILRNISRFDAGRVDCSASNTLSTVNRQFLLYVKCKS